MTKYILVGGADRASPNYLHDLKAEIAKTIHGPLRVLSCFFAEPREVWEEKFKVRIAWFRSGLGDKTHLDLAFPDSFEQQVQASDVIYLHGGDDVLLAHYLDNIPDLAKLWDGKVIVGSSAGANYLARYYWTCDWRQARQGRGLTDLNVIPHFESLQYGKLDPRGPIDWAAARHELQTLVEPGGHVTPLREGQFVAVEQ
ncbi:MAG TPA: Type 1 glutamine amidotransferase-like domain-containing protein [Candidatus Saccharimonadales bacterium]|nr:Type 1 glutamine amidotransferase-like domain-containing protein [Candidatus Saccharimonadales bacterium]